MITYYHPRCDYPKCPICKPLEHWETKGHQCDGCDNCCNCDGCHCNTDIDCECMSASS